jgi:hypothetical protein
MSGSPCRVPGELAAEAAGLRSASGLHLAAPERTRLSSNADPDLAEYPETGKLGIITDGKTWEFFLRTDIKEHAL